MPATSKKQSIHPSEAVRIAEQYPSKQYIYIRNAHQHNLKNLDVLFPKEKFIVITGPSGSGKSSLAMDTLYAEGRRKYAESLSAYIRQFLGKIEKPKVDFIHGLAPAIALEQRVVSNNPRSSVGTVTEIYDYLKLLFLRIGKIYHPNTGQEIRKHTVRDVVHYVTHLPKGTRCYLVSSSEHILQKHPHDWAGYFRSQGINRILYKNELYDIDDWEGSEIDKKFKIFPVIDRFSVVENAAHDDEFLSRLEDSIASAFREGEEVCYVFHDGHMKMFSRRWNTGDGFSLREPDLSFFSYNHPLGACPVCEGFGSILGLDPYKIIPDRNRSVYDDAIACWRGEVYQWYKKQLLKNAWKFNFPVHTPVRELSEKQYRLLWEGNEYFTGINDFFKDIEKELYKIQNRVFLSRYRGKTLCPSCEGSRLNPATDSVKIGGRHLRSLLLDEVQNLIEFFKNLELTEQEKNLSKIVFQEIVHRLQYLADVGLGYLTLHRSMNTLSGGENQRVNLATQLASTLCGSVYILDEPSIGLHPQDTHRLIGILKKLRDQGNTVIVVEHDEQILRASDWITDLGPGAGIHGGYILYNGPSEKIFSIKSSSSTLDYLSGKKSNVPKNKSEPPLNEWIRFYPSTRNHLKIGEVKIPVGALTVVCGVSGSGKSTLVLEEFVPTYLQVLESSKEIESKIKVTPSSPEFLEVVDQKPIGRSTRSNAITYLKVYDDIRALYAQTDQARRKGLSPGYFSFNVEGGRCEKCKGEGTLTIEMQFMADVEIPCDACEGKRFKEEALEIVFEGLNIVQLLDKSIEEAYDFFSKSDHTLVQKITKGLKPLLDVGLGYLKMGQSSSTLSGGEAQRIKLAYFLSGKHHSGKGLFVFDEPTTGLHFTDVGRLIDCIRALKQHGHTLLIIEHHTDIIAHADYVIELGPGGGKFGGQIIFEGRPKEMLKSQNSNTGRFLKLL